MYINNRSWSLIIDRNKNKYPQIVLGECICKPGRSIEKSRLNSNIFSDSESDNRTVSDSETNHKIDSDSEGDDGRNSYSEIDDKN